MNIPEKLVKAVMNSCSTDENTAREYIENSVKSIHEWMDKGVDPSSQTGYGGNYFKEELDNLGLDSDYELAFAELCMYNYPKKERYTVYVDGDKFETFTDETDAEIAADHEFYLAVVDDVLDEYYKKEGLGGKLTLEDIKGIVSSTSVSVIVKNSKGEIMYDCKNEQTIEETAEAIAYNMKKNKMMESRSRRGRMLKENKGEKNMNIEREFVRDNTGREMARELAKHYLSRAKKIKEEDPDLDMDDLVVETSIYAGYGHDNVFEVISIQLRDMFEDELEKMIGGRN